MQRGLIRQRPREQRRPGLLLLDAESATPERRARKGEQWKITIPEHRSGLRKV